MSLNPRQAELVSRIKEALRENGEPAPSLVISRLVGVPPQAVEQAVRAAMSGDREIRDFGVAGFGLASWSQAIYAGANALFGDAVFGPKDLRQELMVPRRTVMELLDVWQEDGLARKVEGGYQLTERESHA